MNFRRSSPLFAVKTNDGIIGYGEVNGPVNVIRGYLATLKPFYIGRRIYDAAHIEAYIRGKLYHFGEGHFAACISALDVALHDAMGKTLGLPTHDLIGGRGADRVPCYATTGYVTQDGMAGLEAQLIKVDRKAFTGVKIKIGLNPRSDVDRVRLARKILGDDVLLMVDVNGNYTPDVALQSIRAIEPYNIHWYEEPLPAHDISGHAELRARSPIPIATGEGLHALHEFEQLLEARGVDVLQPALAKCGGFAGAKAIATLADCANVRLVPGVWGGAVIVAASIHFLASRPPVPHTDNVPFPTLLEFDIADNPLRDNLVRQPFRPEGGYVAVPSGPGLGIEFVAESFKQYTAQP
jgi:D-galactarolactone cycloisomerase